MNPSMTALFKHVMSAVTLALTAMSTAHALEVQLPPETAHYRPNDLPGYGVVQQNCMTCHSAQYVQTQPPSSRTYWDATVRKMKKPFGAPIRDEDIPAMVDYLVKTYGTERTALAGQSADKPAAPPSAPAHAGAVSRDTR